MRSRRHRLFFLFLFSIFALVARIHVVHAASVYTPMFNEVLQSIQGNKTFAVHAKLLEIAPHLTKSQKNEIRFALRKHLEVYEFSLMYMADLSEMEDIRELTVLFLNLYVRLSYSMPEAIEEEFPPDPRMSFGFLDGFEHTLINLAAVDKLHEAFKKNDATAVKAIELAKKYAEEKGHEEDRHFYEAFFEKLTKTGFRHGLSNCEYKYLM